ncbi:hypothetical protein ACH4GM_04930 [Streptomyces coeruleorubidus]|uniref:hypothetical protein n=1 Tax=Streptomyces coeruleorubidus TaxID=116188 RepID=UPI00378D3118
MRRSGTAAIVIALASLGLMAPTTSAAAADDNLCAARWPGRDGNVRAWVDWGCNGDRPLGVTPGDDRSWGDDVGAFQRPANIVASSVMNSGFVGGRDVVAFYYDKDYQYQNGYVCLAPGEKWADNLTDNYFHNRPGQVVNDRIGSHRWVTATECAAGSWLT